MNNVQPDITTWNKILSKKPLLIGILFLVVLSFLSIFAFLFIPDKSENANTQHLQIAMKTPGFTSKILLLNRNNDAFIPFKDIDTQNERIQITTHLNSTQFISNSELRYEGDFNRNMKERTFLLGTDRYGRSIFSRLLLGIRISLFIGFLSVIVSVFIGISLGAIAGYFGGKVDQLIMFFINVTWSIPTLLLVFAIVLAFGRSVSIIFLAVGLTMWVDVARIVRGQVLSLKTQQFIQAAKSMAYSNTRIILQHILPNIIGPILVIAAANFSIAILIEAGLSYLGFGIQPPAPSIGNMLYENYGYAISGKPFLALIPGFTIMLLVLSFNIIGSGLRDVFDIKSIKK